MSLLKAESFYKPFKYPWAYEAWLIQQRIHWLAQEVPMADDVEDWKRKVTEQEKHLLTQIFRFFTQADIEVSNCYMTKYMQVFQPTEIRMMLSAFSNTETIHINAYSHLLDTVGMPEIEYQAFTEYKEMVDKHEYMQQFNMDSVENIAKTLAIYGAFTEGLQLFASFAMLMNFQRFGKMKGVGQIVSWSIRDETLHTGSIIRLYLTLLEENPQIDREKLEEFIYNCCKQMVDHEDAFIDLAFKLEGAIEGMKAQEIKDYIRFIANRRLRQLQLNEIYEIKINPLPWMDEILNAPEHTNFFENKATEYSKAATTGSWEEAFDF